jgi:integrase
MALAVENGIVPQPRIIHACRHSFATWMSEGDPERGIPPVDKQIVQRWMGHAKESQLRRYQHPKAMAPSTDFNRLMDDV